MIGIIGGSGLYDLKLQGKRKVSVKTPFGKPSDKVVVGRLGKNEVAFLARHGEGHTLSPSEVNYRANIYALKKLGVDRIISVQAVGSLKESYRPADIVVPDQIIDRTQGRMSSFFTGGVVAHVGMAEPFCKDLSRLLVNVARVQGLQVHAWATYLCMEGPRFSTKAESRLYRQWGADIIGMTVKPEASLAREAEICYASLATVTDYDVWKEQEVSVEMILGNMKKNEEAVRKVLMEAIPKISASRKCNCGNALAGAVITDQKRISPAQKARLNMIMERYWKPPVSRRQAMEEARKKAKRRERKKRGKKAGRKLKRAGGKRKGEKA